MEQIEYLLQEIDKTWFIMITTKCSIGSHVYMTIRTALINNFRSDKFIMTAHIRNTLNDNIQKEK